MKTIEIKNLEIKFNLDNKEYSVIDDISFDVNKSEIVGIVGESGSGKSICVKSILNILPSNANVTNGEILFKNKDLLKLNKQELRNIQGNEISMIFQDSLSALNPLKTIGSHIEEVLIRHKKISKKEAQQITYQLLDSVGIANSKSSAKLYPHQFSGGMRQRVIIALAIACNPKLLIADEPTTALDVTTQLQILKLIKTLQTNSDMSVLLITHDLAVVYSMCERVIIMYAGKVMEAGTREEIFNSPKHPYTKALLRSIPSGNEEKLYAMPGAILGIKTLRSGCVFAPRCSKARERCFKEEPNRHTLSNDHYAYCFYVEDNDE